VPLAAIYRDSYLPKMPPEVLEADGYLVKVPPVLSRTDSYLVKTFLEAIYRGIYLLEVTSSSIL
jgi:hypothetical protein